MTTRRILPGLALLALTLFACAGSAWAATVTGSKAKKSSAPVITKISPLHAKIGDRLTIYGKNFVPGKGKTRVFFLRVGGGATWVRSDAGTKKKVVVHVPKTLQKLLPTDGHATRFQIRVLGKRFGSPSKTSKSPLISGPAGANGGAGAGGGGSLGPASAVVGPTNGVAGCTPNFTDGSVDSDGDLLPDVEEHRIGTDPCAKDTDQDGVEDGYEYYSAKDLNSAALPYPWKMPYPNALNPDSGTDYDGDGLTNGDEFALWIKYGSHALPLNYSDGKQTTVATAAPDPVAQPLLNWSLDLNQDGQLNDGERDADGDGLSNWAESHGPMTHDWWTKAYKLEHPYPVTFAGTNMMDPDTDGDGVLDGQDDNDFDGYTNMFEVYRPSNWSVTYVSLAHNWTPPATLGGQGTVNDPAPADPAVNADPYARVNPFNPCKPTFSAVCHLHPPFDYYDSTEDWASPSRAEIEAAVNGSSPGTLP